jgi:hypothetical protein
MFDHYPDQSSARRGLALVGALFIIFGVAMAIFNSILEALLGFILGGALLLPALFCGHAAFEK